MKLKIGVDMDGVLCDFTRSALKNVKKEFGLDIKYKNVTEPAMGKMVYDLLPPEKQKALYGSREVYDYICKPGFFEGLKAFPGAIKTLKKLCEEHEVTIITKPLEWKHCPGEKYRWIKHRLGDAKFNFILVSSFELKSLVDVDVMIDDDPRVHRNLTTAVGVLVERPWNQDFLKFEAIKSIAGIQDVPEALKDIQENYFFAKIN